MMPSYGGKLNQSRGRYIDLVSTTQTRKHLLINIFVPKICEELRTCRQDSSGSTASTQYPKCGTGPLSGQIQDCAEDFHQWAFQQPWLARAWNVVDILYSTSIRVNKPTNFMHTLHAKPSIKIVLGDSVGQLCIHASSHLPWRQCQPDLHSPIIAQNSLKEVVLGTMSGTFAFNHRPVVLGDFVSQLFLHPL